MTTPHPHNPGLFRSSTLPVIPQSQNEHPVEPLSPLQLHDESGMEYLDNPTPQPALLANHRNLVQSLQTIPYPAQPNQPNQPSLFAFRQESIRGSRMLRIPSAQGAPEPGRMPSRANIPVIIPIENIEEEGQTPTASSGRQEHNIQVEDTTPRHDSQTERIAKAASLRVWIQFTFNTFVLLCYVLGYLLVKHVISPEAAIGIAFGFIYLALFGPLRAKGMYLDFDRGDIFLSSCHLICLSLFAALVCVKLNGSDVPLIQLSFVGIILLFGSCCKNSVDEPTPSKAIMLMGHLYIWVQLLLVSLRLEDLPLPWGTIFIPTFFALVLMAFSSVLIILAALFAFANVIREEGISKELVIGSLWYILNALYTIIWLFVVTGLVTHLDNNEGTDSLEIALKLGFIHSGVLFLYTVLLWKIIRKFQEFEVQSEMLVPEDEVSANEGDYEAHDQNPQVRFQVSKDNKTYLKMISSTFYAYLGKHLQGKDNKAASTIQKEIMQAKMQKKPHGLEMNLPHRTDVVANQVNAGLSPPRKVKARNLDFSDGDIKASGEPAMMMKKGESMKSNGDQCIVCFDCVPNGVFMDCGHGGICYECALETWKKSDNCVFCRQKIKKILKIVNCKPLNVIKVVETTTKVVEQQ